MEWDGVGFSMHIEFVKNSVQATNVPEEVVVTQLAQTHLKFVIMLHTMSIFMNQNKNVVWQICHFNE
jgi:hypothetical protein